MNLTFFAILELMKGKVLIYVSERMCGILALFCANGNGNSSYDLRAEVSHFNIYCIEMLKHEYWFLSRFFYKHENVLEGIIGR